MNEVRNLFDLMESHVRTVCENFYCEVRLSELQTGKEFTEMVERARGSNDKRAHIKNKICEKMVEIVEKKGVKQPEKTGEIWESLGFLWDRYVIENLKVWHFEEKLRIYKNNDMKNPSAVAELVRSSRVANDNRIELRDAVEKKLLGILAGTEKVGNAESKMFFVQGRK